MHGSPPSPAASRAARRALALLLAAALLPAAAPRLDAANVCVATSQELRDALSAARANGEPDTIRIVQGLYVTDAQGEFYYFTQEDHGLVVLGGYTGGCGDRQLEPTNTVLDGQNANRVMHLFMDNDTAGPIHVQGLTFRNGHTTGFDDGAGLRAGGSAGHSGDVTVDHCIFRDNSTDYFGGGLSGGSDTGVTRVENNLLIDNAAGIAHGAASLTSNGTSFITNNTVYGNTAPDRGGLRLGGTPTGGHTISNNVFWGNTGADLVLDSNLIVTRNNDIGVQIGTEAAGSSGNLSVAPQLAGGGDYHLLSYSTLVDAGLNDPPGGLAATDIEGRDRIYNGTVDIGAYEWSGQPDAVELAAFTATPAPGAIELRWETAFESDHLGFHVRRANAGGGERLRLTAALIEPPGPYAFTDTAVEPGTTYSYWLEALDRRGGSELFGPLAATPAPRRWRPALAQSSPNPFPLAGPAVAIGFELAAPAHARLRIYDAGGRLVRALLDAPLATGRQVVAWDGRDGRGAMTGTGVYFYRLEAGEFSASRRLVRIR